MHTAFKFKAKDFDIEVGGKAAGRGDVLVDWADRDRLGIVVDAPFGATGAGLLILLAATAFFDGEGGRRRRRPLYPDIYLFHAGGPWGNHWIYDFWPDYKEVRVPAERQDLLNAINGRGITYLLVPDAAPDPAPFRYKTKEEATTRLKGAFAYAPLGSVSDADVRLTTESAAAISDYRSTVFPEAIIDQMTISLPNDPTRRAGTAMGDDSRRGLALARERLSEVRSDDPMRLKAITRLVAAEQAGRLEETYRRVPNGVAIDMLAS